MAVKINIQIRYRIYEQEHYRNKHFIGCYLYRSNKKRVQRDPILPNPCQLYGTEGRILNLPNDINNLQKSMLV
jgi:hypothetical protein